MMKRLTLALAAGVLVGAMLPGVAAAKKPDDLGCCSLGNSRHVYAQIIDEETGRVLANVVTPVPISLYGRTHTVTIPKSKDTRLIIDLGIKSADPHANFGVIHLDHIVLELPVGHRRGNK